MAVPSSPAEVQALAALEAAATPGPWEARDGGTQIWARGLCIYAGRRDAALIVAARNALPGLLAGLAAAEAERDACREAARIADALDLGALPRAEKAEAEAAALRGIERERDAAAGEAQRLRAALKAACDVAIWMSGSPSFGPGGDSHEGWANVMRPKLYAAMEALSSVPLSGGPL